MGYIKWPKINGINLDLTNVSKMNMIVASHESINGDYKKLKEMFKRILLISIGVKAV